MCYTITTPKTKKIFKTLIEAIHYTNLTHKPINFNNNSWPETVLAG